MRMAVTPSQNRGFSLVELSVVLVIIGLLAGAVVGGQALIRNAEMQSIVSDYSRYKEAYVTFKKQYATIPGDMLDAEEFWGQSTACSGASATGTCNGNGDGILDYSAGAGDSGETFQFWRQLALAGRITGNYSGVSGSGGAVDSSPEANIPGSRIATAGWDVGNSATITDAHYDIDFGNYLRIGGKVAGSPAVGAILTPEEAWKIDTKMDDGSPGRGSLISSMGNCTLASSASDTDAGYKLQENNVQCSLFFVKQYP